MKHPLTKHKERLQNQLEQASQQLNVLHEIDEQKIPDFPEIIEVTKKEKWHEFHQSGDEWFTDFDIEFYEAKTVNGNFLYAIDHASDVGDLSLPLRYLCVPNATKEQTETVAQYVKNQAKENRSDFVLLHDYLNLNAFLEQAKASFTCVNTTSRDWYEQQTGNLLAIGQQYEGYWINDDRYYVFFNNNYYHFTKRELDVFFRIEKKIL